jgi:hypothetical protein
LGREKKEASDAADSRPLRACGGNGCARVGGPAAAGEEGVTVERETGGPAAVGDAACGTAKGAGAGAPAPGGSEGTVRGGDWVDLLVRVAKVCSTGERLGGGEAGAAADVSRGGSAGVEETGREVDEIGRECRGLTGTFKPSSRPRPELEDTGRE